MHRLLAQTQRAALGTPAVLRRRSTLGAAAAAAAAATAAVSLCDAPSASVPPFILGGERYDQSTFSGRLAKIQELIDMRTVLTTDEELASCQSKLAETKRLGRKPDDTSDEEMWEAQRTVEAIVHGPTGEKMFLPGRMSMFVPMNIPATAGMVMSTSVPAQLFWQWMNQTCVGRKQATPSPFGSGRRRVSRRCRVTGTTW